MLLVRVGASILEPKKETTLEGPGANVTEVGDAM